MGKRSGLGLAAGLGVLVVAMAIFFQVAENRREAHVGKIAISGGGFLYNYRIGEIRYGLSIHVVRPVPIGTRLQVAFENPAGGDPIMVTKSLGTDTNRVPVESPAITGLENGREYKVIVRLRDRDTDALMETHEASYRVSVDPDLVPDAPLTVGPGYHRNPGAEGEDRGAEGAGND